MTFRLWIRQNTIKMAKLQKWAKYIQSLYFRMSYVMYAGLLCA